jgi:fumarylacetoacetate (FAA) hydrolase
MRLATRKSNSRDGTLVVIDRAGTHCTCAAHIAPTLQGALDQWDELAPRLRALADELNAGSAPREAIDFEQLCAPLPRAYEWVDGSAYIHHIELVRRARGAEPPETLRTEPLVYQGGSGQMLGPREAVQLGDPSWGLDFEAELCVVLGDTPRGASGAHAASCIKLLTLVNDLTYRNLIPQELKKGFGFFQSKPASAFAPFAVTPEELGAAYKGARVHLRLRSLLNGTLIGDPEAGDAMHFSFRDLITHIARTRAFTAGTLLGSGTVSNVEPARGSSCLAEVRAREFIESGAATTTFLKAGDRIRMEMSDAEGRDIFGPIDQEVIP